MEKREKKKKNQQKKNIPQGIARGRYLSHCSLGEVIISEPASHVMFLCYY